MNRQAAAAFALGLLCFAVGVAAGLAIDSPPPDPPDTITIEGHSPLICAERPEQRVSARSPEETDVRLQWCLAQLSQVRADQRAVRNTWPEERAYADNELPEAWTDMMEGVFRDCALPADLVVTDCSEPPCVAVLRADDPEALGQALDGCATFSEAFPDPEVGLAPMAMPCGDGRWERMLLLTTFDEDQRRAYFDDIGVGALFSGESLDMDPLFEGYRILGRRADGLLPFWDCAEGG